MRPKHFPVIFVAVVVLTFIFFMLAPAGEPKDSFNSIVTTTHQHFKVLKENLGVATESKQLDIEPKYLEILGFISRDASLNNNNYRYHSKFDDAGTLDAHTSDADMLNFVEMTHRPLQPSSSSSSGSGSESLTLQRGGGAARRTGGGGGGVGGGGGAITPYNNTKLSFSIVTYAHDGQSPAIILLAQNIAQKLPNEYLLIYDLGLSETETRSLNSFCNNTKCQLINYDLTVFPSHVTDQRMHAFRPILTKDALMRAKTILLMENYMRIRGNSQDLQNLLNKVRISGVLGWSTPIASSSRTHHKMFDYFKTEPDNFLFQRMVNLEACFFTDTLFVTEKILLPWIKCVLKSDCIDPIGAQSIGCKKKKPLFRYSGCHAYDVSAFNVVLGLTWHFDDSKYSLPNKTSHMFYKETLEQATKILENWRRNSSEPSERPFTED